MAGRMSRSSVLTRCILTASNYFSRNALSSSSKLSQADLVLSKVDPSKGICQLTLNNPAKRNALSFSMLSALEHHLTEASNQESTKVIIIRSEGKVFSAGHDLRELTTERGSKLHRDVFEKCSQLMCMIEDLSIPVIAEVSGLATAAGCQLVASCDIAVASAEARFATPGVHVGLFCSTPAVAVGRSLPRKIVMEMLLTGEPISAQEALMYGLISRVVPTDKLQEATLDIAQKVSLKSRAVIQLGKRCFNSQMKKDRDDAYVEATEAMLENVKLLDCQEGINAFIEKRYAQWTHRKEYVKRD